ncbi:uncharacterized protein LOC125377495 [Haliotis rufescens]|uniref:uncharacterized protein LOC125377495 n=1 Tax=Haliotis rufescens TaxID=6454 RepID=UPI00201EC229|nr:uncharacterized protein LOC125377495 [Haliotis rufescens]
MDVSDCDRELFITQSKTVEKSDEAESDDDFLFRFKEPLNEKELTDKIEKRIPQNKIDWALSVFKRWREERRSRSIDNNLDIPSECLKTELSEMSAADLNIALKYVLFEAAKKDRTNYPSNTLYGLYGAFQSHLKAQYSKSNLFEDDEFREARAALDAVMKERAAAGLGAASRKSAEIITETDENMLWERSLWTRFYT